MEPLFHAQVATVRTADIVDPSSFVEPGRLHNERGVVLPLASGVAVPPRLGNIVRRKPAAVGPYAAKRPIVLVKDQHLLWILDDLYRAQIEEFYARKADGVATIERIVIERDGNFCRSKSRLVRFPRFLAQRRERQFMLRLSVRRILLCAKELHAIPPTSRRFPDSRQIASRRRGCLLILWRRGHFLVPAVDMLLLVLRRRRSILIGRRERRARVILRPRRKRKHGCCKHSCRDHEAVQHIGNPFRHIRGLLVYPRNHVPFASMTRWIRPTGAPLSGVIIATV